MEIQRVTRRQNAAMVEKHPTAHGILPCDVALRVVTGTDRAGALSLPLTSFHIRAPSTPVGRGGFEVTFDRDFRGRDGPLAPSRSPDRGSLAEFREVDGNPSRDGKAHSVEVWWLAASCGVCRCTWEALSSRNQISSA